MNTVRKVTNFYSKSLNRQNAWKICPEYPKCLMLNTKKYALFYFQIVLKYLIQSDSSVSIRFWNSMKDLTLNCRIERKRQKSPRT